jgi:hypothetical protein
MSQSSSASLSRKGYVEQGTATSVSCSSQPLVSFLGRWSVDRSVVLSVGRSVGRSAS